MIRWMIDAGHLDEDGDPTIGLKSGKAKTSRDWWLLDLDRGRHVVVSREVAAWYRGSPDVRHSALRLPATGGAHRFGPPHLRQIVRRMAVQIATEKSRSNTTVTVPVRPEFEESLRAARAAGIIGADVFTGKMIKGPRAGDEQDGVGGKVQEVRSTRRHQ